MDRLVEKFRTIDGSGLPNPLNLGDDRMKVFGILAISAKDAETCKMTPHEISTVLREIFGINISWQRIRSLLGSEKKTVAKVRKDGRKAYQLMNEGLELIKGGGGTTILVQPETAYTSVAAIELSRKLTDPFYRTVLTACTRNETEACGERPIVTCENTNSTVIYLKKAAETKLILDGNCVTIQGTGQEIIRAADKALFQWLGIMS